MLILYLAWALVALCVAMYAYMRWALTYWQRRKIVFVPPSVPFGNCGSLFQGKKSMGQHASDIYFAHNDERFIGTYFLATPMLHIHDPEIIKTVMTGEFQDFNGRGTFCDPVNDPLSGHLFNLSAQPWRNLRVKLSPTFTTGKIKFMFQTITECADFLSAHVTGSMSANGGAYVEDLRELAARFSTDIISSVAFGIESNSLKNPDSELRRMGSKMFSPGFGVNSRLLLTFFGGGIMKAFNIRSVPSDVHNFFNRIVMEMITYREKSGVERADMMNLLIKLKNEGFVVPDKEESGEGRGNGQTHSPAGEVACEPEKQKLTPGVIAAQVFVFFLAGFETTSSTTSFAMFELAKDTEVQDKVVAEIEAAFKKHGGKITYEMIMDLTYMDMVINETLRMYPPVTFLTREAMLKRQLPLTDVMLEKGTRLMIPVQGLHHDPQFWTDPNRFDPLRFTEEAKKSRPGGVYMPFGDGPRICIGMRLGLVQVKVGLVTILSKSRVSLAPGMPRDVQMAPRSLVPQPVGGIQLTLKAR